ncbi:hypothetical protein K8I61_03220 [bacterium]|nr:hypothetical protein [bacterium]
MTRAAPRYFVFVFIALVALAAPACSCGDDDDGGAGDAPDDDVTDDDTIDVDVDDDDADDDDTADDDTIDDDAIDDDADDDAIDDDTDDDTADDDAALDRFVTVPAPLVEDEPAYVLVQRRYRIGDDNVTEPALFPVDGGAPRYGSPVLLGAFGGASYIVEDFTGDGLAEIVAIENSLDDEGVGSALVRLLDPANLDSSVTIASYPGGQALPGPLFDLDRNGFPELVIRVRPTDASGSGEAHAYDGTEGFADLLNHTGPAGTYVDLAAAPARSAWGKAAPLSAGPAAEIAVIEWGIVGPLYEATIRAVAEGGIAGDTYGPFAQNGAASPSVAIRDLDGDGDAELAIAFANASETRVELHESLGQASRNFTYDAGTSASVSLRHDLDGDGLADLVASLVGGGGAWVDLYASSAAYFFPTAFDFGGTRAFVADAPRAGGIGGRAKFGGDVFAIAHAVTGASASAKVSLFDDPEQPAVAETTQIAGEGSLLVFDAALRDFDGDDDAELAVFQTQLQGLVAPQIAYRLTVFSTASTTVYDTGFTVGAGARGASWDYDGDGAAEVQLIRYGQGTSAVPRVEMRDGAGDWNTPVFEIVGPAGSDVLIYGLVR